MNTFSVLTNKVARFGVVVMVGAVLAGCGSSAIEDVKKDLMNKNPPVTYEKFFSTYKYAQNVTWEEIEHERVGKVVVVSIQYKDPEEFKAVAGKNAMDRKQRMIDSIEQRIKEEREAKIKEVEREIRHNALQFPEGSISIEALKKAETALISQGVIKAGYVQWPYAGNSIKTTDYVEYLNREIENHKKRIRSHANSVQFYKKELARAEALKGAGRDAEIRKVQFDLKNQQEEEQAYRNKLDQTVKIKEKLLPLAKSCTEELKQSSRVNLEKKLQEAKVYVNPELREEVARGRKERNQILKMFDVKSVVDKFYIVPPSDKSSSAYLGGKTCVVWADGKVAERQRPAFLEIPVLTYIAEQKPICPAKGDNTPYVYKSFTEIYPKDN